ncbi:YtpR family tRNA-binding protein [Leuconostoc citreum]|uniref:YtpR family tRNA-binding protein n=1 Tax=Leuconostoc citreum TaxID=33964 RepID=UPI00200A118D|nr:DUF4479 domain-containing protein [Leuconostoc citreum]MCK8604502.1 DUF4479 and tRNA-binding domain-containing protein [Leuconostoc citreum]
MIASYNYDAMGDVLVIVLAPNAEKQSVMTVEQVTRIQNDETNEATGFNIRGLGKKLGLVNISGGVALNDKQVALINQAISMAGFPEMLAATASKLVIGRVLTMAEHPDSDHLHVTTTAVAEDKTLQIVSGSPNMQEGIKVVVAQPGTMMPSGAIIWDGALRGVPSSGMIVSGRELQIPGAPDKPGALVLPEDFGHIGEPFDLTKAQTLYSDGLVDIDY